jgi:hypothetical protein
MRTAARTTTIALTALLAASLLAASPAAASACSDPGKDDINGDGFADTVVTEYGRNRLSGGVHVLYGTENGLTADAVGTAPDDQFLTQSSRGVPGSSEAMDEWGAALVLADLNGDGCADLAVGAPGENGATGAVTILYGTPAGLRGAGAQQLSQNSPGLRGEAEPNDRFGTALAAGDFDDDGIADLAVGAPGEAFGTAYQAGWVSVLYGAKDGLNRGRAARSLAQGEKNLGSVPEDDDRFGAALAAGDFDDDGRDDLAVGAPGENGAAGTVHVVISTATGVGRTAAGLTRATPGVPEVPARGDAFGAALAAGNFDGKGGDDLAVGIPGEDRRAGGVSVLYSEGAKGITGRTADHCNQASPGVHGDPGAGDGFGAALAAGRLNAGKIDDLAVGVPADDVGEVADAGAVHVLYGTDDGLTGEGSRHVHQNNKGVGGVAATGDRFGLSVAVARILGGAVDSLVVGVPAEGVVGTSTQNAGAFQVLGRSDDGPTATKSRLWTLEDEGLRGDSVPGSFLGYTFG